MRRQARRVTGGGFAGPFPLQGGGDADGRLEGAEALASNEARHGRFGQAGVRGQPRLALEGVAGGVGHDSSTTVSNLRWLFEHRQELGNPPAIRRRTGVLTGPVRLGGTPTIDGFAQSLKEPVTFGRLEGLHIRMSA